MKGKDSETVFTGFRLPRSLWLRAKILALRRKRSLEDLVCAAIFEALVHPERLPSQWRNGSGKPEAGKIQPRPRQS